MRNYYLHNDDGTSFIECCKKDGKTYKLVLISTESYSIVKDYSWTVSSSTGYAYGSRNSKKIAMHRLVCGLKNGEDNIIDHINKDKIDNRLSNLVVCNHSKNNQNKITKNKYGFIGVAENKSGKKYKAIIRKNYKTTYLGSFDNTLEAARAYDVAAIEIHGISARTNFSDYNLNNETGIVAHP